MSAPIHQIPKIMSGSSKDDQANANTSSKNEEKHITAVEDQSIETDGAPITLPLSIGPSIQNTSIEMIPINRYLDLQNEYQSLVNRYNFMKDEFAEMRIELARLREERAQAWLKKK